MDKVVRTPRPHHRPQTRYLKFKIGIFTNNCIARLAVGGSGAGVRRHGDGVMLSSGAVVEEAG